MADLHVYEVHCGDGRDWIVARSDADVARIMRKDHNYGDQAGYWITRLPAAHKISIPCNRKGELVDYVSSRAKTKTCAAWAKLQGRGHLCSEDY